MVKTSLFFLVVLFFAAIAPVVNGSKSDLEESLDVFEKWYWGVQKNENPKTSLKIAPGEDEEVGVFARTTVKEGEEILRVTWNLMITAERILEVTELRDFIDQEGWGWNDTDVIAFYLLYIKKCGPEVNPWANWLVTLPEKFSSILYFKEDEVKLLQGTSVYESCLNKRTESKMSWETIQKEIIKKKEFKCSSKLDYSDWKWALSVVASRKMWLVDANHKRFPTVIPYFDFFNHYTASVVKPSFGFIADAKIFHVEASKSYLKGQQIVQHYGDFTNAELLMDYGFTLTNNHDSKIVIPLRFFQVNPEDVWFDQKTALLETLLKNPKELFITSTAISEKLLQAVRVIVSAPEDYQDEDMTILKPQTSVIVDFEMSRWFRGVLSSLMIEFPNSIQDDERFVQSSIFTGSSPRVQMAVEVRMEEKRMMLKSLQFWEKKQQAILDAAQKLKEQQDKEEL